MSCLLSLTGRISQAASIAFLHQMLTFDGRYGEALLHCCAGVHVYGVTLVLHWHCSASRWGREGAPSIARLAPLEGRRGSKTFSPAAWETTPAGGRNTWFRPRERVRLCKRAHGVGGGGLRPDTPWGRRSPNPMRCGAR